MAVSDDVGSYGGIDSYNSTWAYGSACPSIIGESSDEPSDGGYMSGIIDEYYAADAVYGDVGAA